MLLLGSNLPVSKLMGFAFQKNNVPPEVVEAYSAPFPSPLFKAGAARWPLLVPLLKAAWSTLIGRGMSRLGSHWSRASLVMRAPAILCHKEPARASKAPASWFFMA